MRIRDFIKSILPSYKTEKHIMERLSKIEKDIRESNKKNEFLFWMNQMQPGETMEQTKKRVFLQMPKATGRLRNIQLAEKYILERVKDVCDANGLELFLVGGTLLGAVRHKGFIPWDNDIDVGMMKQDYLKLKQLLENHEELTLRNYYKYVDGMKVVKVKIQGIDAFWIDILIFDRIDVSADNLDEVWEQTRKANWDHVHKLQELSTPYNTIQYCRPVENAQIDAAIEAFEEEQLKQFPCFGHGAYFCMPIMTPWWCRDDRGIKPVNRHFPLRKNAVEFEGKMYDVWDHYEEALEHFYGDYMCLPVSISEPHTTELDEGLEEGFAYLADRGIIQR